MSEKHRNITRLYTRLTSEPLFPLLFITEAVKEFVAAGWVLTDGITDFVLLAVVATILWVLSDAEINWYETVVGPSDDE